MSGVHDTGNVGAVHLLDQVDGQFPEPGRCTECKASLEGCVNKAASKESRMIALSRLTLLTNTSMSPRSETISLTASSTWVWFWMSMAYARATTLGNFSVILDTTACSLSYGVVLVANFDYSLPWAYMAPRQQSDIHALLRQGEGNGLSDAHRGSCLQAH